MSGAGSDWDAESADGPEIGALRADGERADRLKKSPSAFRTISEVADDLHIPQHVLRFWETRFPQVKPLKRGGGRRYYRPDDIALLRRISELLYIQGYTIKGVQRLLREGDGTLMDVPPPDPADAEQGQGVDLDRSGEDLSVVAGPAADEAPEMMRADAVPTAADPAAPDPAAPGWPPPGMPAARDGVADGLRLVLRDVLDELRLLRRQISA